MTSRTLLTLGALCVAAAVLAYGMGDSYIDRLPSHTGYYLVPVEDTVSVPHPHPRHTVFILVDGLSKSFAEGFASRARLAAEGQCRTMVGGPITVSRPMYSVVSTGLEEDRSGCRNNDETTPLAADSLWQAARRSGLQVTGVSAVRWWQQLFPDGFDRYDVVETEHDDVFGPADIRDLTLIHPLYVDEMGHQHGSASVEYADAARRADQGIMATLDRLDLAQDLVIFTADHGHMSYGGHGGPQREIAEVLTCFAGPGVARRADVGRMDARSLAPAVAVLTGVPFPRHMRAVEDDLDVVFDIADTGALPADYVADRRAAVERFRAENRAQLARWLGPGVPPSWTSLYARQEGAQRARLGAGVFLMILVLSASAWKRRLGVREIWGFLAWAGLTIAVTLAVYAAIRGSLDFTSINTRVEFLSAGLSVCTGTGALSLVGHTRVFSDPRRLLGDQVTFVALLSVAVVLHPLVYGWQLGFPLPSAGLLFFPFFAPVLLLVHALLGCATSVARWRQPRAPHRS